jgi:hypothetical protein
VLVRGGSARIRANSIIGAVGNGSDAPAAIELESCDGGAPIIERNPLIVGAYIDARVTHADGIRAGAGCHPVIEENTLVVGQAWVGWADRADGIDCAGGSQCSVIGNGTITGCLDLVVPFVKATGVRCTDGSCTRIERNATIVGGASCLNGVGVALERSSPLVRRNVISGGCPQSGTGIGLTSVESGARVENNLIVGTDCNRFINASTGVAIVNATLASEIDLHSNTIVANQSGASVVAVRAISFSAADSGTAAGGVIRNNILAAGSSIYRTPVCLEELDPDADPRVLENNLFLQPDGGPLYRDEGSTDLSDAGAINRLLDLTASGNLEGDPAFVPDGGSRIGGASICRNSGTSAGAPADDLDGKSRPAESAFDIGAHEYVP